MLRKVNERDTPSAYLHRYFCVMIIFLGSRKIIIQVHSIHEAGKKKHEFENTLSRERDKI